MVDKPCFRMKGVLFFLLTLLLNGAYTQSQRQSIMLIAVAICIILIRLAYMIKGKNPQPYIIYLSK